MRKCLLILSLLPSSRCQAVSMACVHENMCGEVADLGRLNFEDIVLEWMKDDLFVALIRLGHLSVDYQHLREDKTRDTKISRNYPSCFES